MRVKLFVLYLFALGGCASAPVPPPAPVAVCIPVRTYTADEQKALGAAVAALPASSPIIPAILDYEAMRDASRACSAH